MFEGPLNEGIVGQAIKAGKIQFQTWDPRQAAKDNHKTVDDRPFGGGDGMVLLPEIMTEVLGQVPGERKNPRRRVIYLSPQGPVLTQSKAQDLAAKYDQIVLLCGRYGGIDERFLENEVDEEVSVGDYILSGGELGALVLIDTVSRFIPGVLGNELSPLEESFKNGLLEHPLYTRPREYQGKAVPDVLLSGNHGKIEKWRREQQILRTLSKRPDLLAQADVSQAEILEAQKNLPQRKNVAVGLVHYPVYNKVGDVVATNVTNLDVHDIARACRTYGVDNFYIITPADEQLAFVGRLLEHWQKGRGLQYNPIRSDSLENTKTAPSIEAALEDWGQPHTKLISTSARQIVGPPVVKYGELRQMALKEPLFILFGTGYGLENSIVRGADYSLEPIRGRSPDGFRHLSVRSAVSIILDRLFGPCY